MIRLTLTGSSLSKQVGKKVCIPCFVLFDGDNGSGVRAAKQGKSRSQADRSAVNANRRIAKYLGI